MNEIVPSDVNPAAAQPDPTQLPVGVFTEQPMSAHALASLGWHELPEPDVQGPWRRSGGRRERRVCDVTWAGITFFGTLK